jgi:GT2 family glycosyltransferase
MKFAIVTTCLQPGRFLIDTLQSVIGQSGDFSLHYHVQDAGSTDGAVELLCSQAEQIERGNTPIQCRELSFSYASEPDQGMYDGINRGFRFLLKHFNANVMLWINADDTLMPGALSMLAKYFGDHPDVDWLIGRTLQQDEEGTIKINTPPHIYRRGCLSSGKHDGVGLPYVTQEATAWRRRLWEICGKLDSRLQYAGDFEYWMRAADCGFELHSVNFEVGCHRKRTGQLSAVGCYADEIRLTVMDRIKLNGK